ncbi:uroporphyrinogen-III synthase [Antarcticimicrobium luteum]|uniref:Uroporphyrinogen-III synthase n=1 Tax=Antarcticimicrobium luteum TaxID=2547397 RepID=A0A4R5UZD5_9RHOB|nr:uroporphyrinogen-III synthase [Antarcticimicrobium luteum]TDK44476.1 uroporphyrinogen-III synthase [Antarcticimicrobium luteum]
MLTLLMTRPRAAAERFVAQLAPGVRDRLRVICSPLMEIALRPGAVSAQDARGVIFTSANGVAAARAAGLRPALPAYCVGAATADAARRDGWPVEETRDTADALVAALVLRRPPAPLLHMRGTHARGEISGRLTAAGIETRAQAVYDQRLVGLDSAALAALAGDGPVIVPLFSPRSARHFADLCQGSAPLYLAAISPAAAEPVENMGACALIVAERPDGAAMAAAVERLAERASRVEGPRGAQ